MHNSEVSIPVFRHAKRPEWGAALLTWERDGKRAYLFEDGVHRMIAAPYYHLMNSVQLDQTELSAAFCQQISQMSVATAAGVLDPTRDASSMFSFEEQAQLLLGQFPEGFEGEKWRKRHRGDGAKKRLKRHRDAVIKEASEVLKPEHLANAVEQGRDQELWEGICELLAGTDLVPPKDVKALRQRVPRAGRAVTLALAAVLLPEPAEDEADEFSRRFTSLVNELKQMLGRLPSWPLVTSLMALSSPGEHFCVHPPSLGRQRKWMGERALNARKPNAMDYEKALRMATNLKEQLSPLGATAVDLLDIYDFIRAFTTPSASKRLEALRQSNLRSVQPAANSTKEATSAEDSPEVAVQSTPPPESEAAADDDDARAEAA